MKRENEKTGRKGKRETNEPEGKTEMKKNENKNKK